MAHTVFVLGVPWDVLQTLPHNLQWSLRIHAGHKDLTVLLTKGKQKKGEIPHRKCHRAVLSTLQLCWLGEEIQRNKRVLYRLEVEMRTPQLNFQIKSVFVLELSDQDFSREGILWGTLSPTILWALKVWPQHEKLLYFRNPRSTAAG